MPSIERWIADPDFDTSLDQRLRDVGLHVGEADRQVRLQVEDAIDLRAGEGRDARLLVARTRGPTVKPEMPTMRCSSPRA
jgi:hypothetical protein